MPRAAVLFNPVAGRHRARQAVEQAARSLEAAGWAVERLPTERAGHALDLAREHAATQERIVAVGGDGTLREVAQGLFEAGGGCELALIPSGHGNVMARELGVPLGAADAASVAASGAPRRIDAIRVAGELALAMVGVGYDAHVVEAVDRRRRRGVGHLWYGVHGGSLYAASGVLALLDPRARRFRLTVDGRAEGTFAHGLVCNAATYAKAWAVLPDADPTDGELDWHARRAHGPLTTARTLLAARLRRPTPSWAAAAGRGQRYLIEAVDRPLAWQVDGDPRGTTSALEIEVVPGAVSVITPACKNDDGPGA